MSLPTPSPSTTLSINRVAPTWAAITTTVRASTRATGRSCSSTSSKYPGLTPGAMSATPGAMSACMPRRCSALGSASPERQACSLAYRRRDVDLQSEVEIRRHAAHQHRLLKVLAPEHRHVGLHHVEQLRHDRQDAGKVARPGGAFQSVGHRPGRDAYERLLGVYGLERGDEEAIDAALTGERPIAGQVARVLREVFFGTELQWVDEDAQDDAVGALFGPVYEAQVPFVQRAHRGHEPDPAPAGALCARPGVHVLRGRELVHGGMKQTGGRCGSVEAHTTVKPTRSKSSSKANASCKPSRCMTSKLTASVRLRIRSR